jgi:hypothetical protein
MTVVRLGPPQPFGPGRPADLVGTSPDDASPLETELLLSGCGEGVLDSFLDSKRENRLVSGIAVVR